MRRKFDKEFKINAVRLVVEQGVPRAEPVKIWASAYRPLSAGLER